MKFYCNDKSLICLWSLTRRRCEEFESMLPMYLLWGCWLLGRMKFSCLTNMAATGYWSPHVLRNSGYYSAVQQASDAGNGEVPTCDLDVTWTCICYFSFYKSPPNIFHIPSPPDFLSARWVVGTNSKERPVGGSVVPTIPKDPSSRISPSALHWWKKSTTSNRFQDSWLHSCSCLVRDGPWNLTVCMMSGRSQATQVLQTHSKMRTWHSPKA